MRVGQCLRPRLRGDGGSVKDGERINRAGLTQA